MATDEPPRVFITADQAIAALPAGDTVHTFLNPGPSVLLGADWQRETVETAIRSAVKLEIAGPMAREMGHGLVVHKGGGEMVFVEAHEAELARLEAAAHPVAVGEG